MKPSKFATEAARMFSSSKIGLSNKSESAFSEIVDQSFAPALTAFEDLLDALIRYGGHDDDCNPTKDCRCGYRNSFTAAQKILKEWKGEA